MSTPTSCFLPSRHAIDALQRDLAASDLDDPLRLSCARVVLTAPPGCDCPRLDAEHLRAPGIAM